MRADACLGLAALASACAVLAATYPARAYAGSYCGIFVPAYTGCSNTPGGSWVNGYFNENWAHSQYYSILVCERTYIVGGAQISNRCGWSNAYSNCDLYFYYKNGYELSAHVVNDSGAS